MNTETIQQIKEAFLPVAQKIGEGAEFGYEVVYRQQIVEGIISLGWVLACLGIIGLIAYATYKDWENVKHSANVPLVVLGWIPASVLMVSAIAHFDFAMKHLLNPHYYAIEFFVNLVK